MQKVSQPAEQAVPAKQAIVAKTPSSITETPPPMTVSSTEPKTTAPPSNPAVEEPKADSAKARNPARTPVRMAQASESTRQLPVQSQDHAGDTSEAGQPTREPRIIHEVPDQLFQAKPEPEQAPLAQEPAVAQEPADAVERTGQEEDKVPAQPCPQAAPGTPAKKTVLIHELPDHLAESTWPSERPAPMGATAELRKPQCVPQTEDPRPVQPSGGSPGTAGPEPQSLPSGWQVGPTPAVHSPAEAEAWNPEPDWGGSSRIAGCERWREPRKTRVLVVDDDATIRMLLKMGLGRRGYECRTAENGKVAQSLLQQFRPDLILLDLMMPVMDGLAFLQWLRGDARDATPVLVFTNVDTPSITEEALASGANAFACKPLPLKELIGLMHELVPG